MPALNTIANRYRVDDEVTVARRRGWVQIAGIPKSVPIDIDLVGIRYHKTVVFGVRDAVSVDIQGRLGKAGRGDHEETGA